MSKSLVLRIFLSSVLWVLCAASCNPPRCPVQCREGLSYCNGNAVLACAYNLQSQCLEWQLRPCASGEQCLATSGQAAQCTSSRQCNNRYFKKKCIGRTVFWFDECDQQTEQSHICPPETSCKEGTCVKADKPCTSVCNEGQLKCTQAGWVSFCVLLPNRCYAWSNPVPCPNGLSCVNGSCREGSCRDVCKANDTRCLGQGLQLCRKDSSGCTQWSPAYPCAPGQECKGGKCQKEVCPASCAITADCDKDACGDRRACVNGVCAKAQGPCTDKCALNSTRCDGVKLQICRRESTGCTDWGPSIPCLDGQECQSGACVQSPCPKSCASDLDCRKAACGARTQCRNGVCSAPQQQCPGACTSNAQCDIAACGTRRACQNGVCAVPQAQCPGACSANSQCQIPACGARNACQNGVCAAPQQQCPGSCTADSQCDIPACGARRACVSGACAVPQAQCPGSCTADSQCDIAACGTRRACVNGVCGVPQQQCPGSCSSDSQCNIPACGARKACISGACAVPQAQCPSACTADSQCNIAACGTKIKCSSGVCAEPTTGNGWKYGNNVTFFTHPKQNSRTNSSWGSVLTDIVNHELPGDVNNFQDLVTLGHETTHGINGHHRRLWTKGGKKVNGFYVLKDRVLRCDEPNFTMADVAPFIPQVMRANRYQLYLVTQRQYWNDRPLYIYDEWVAYQNGTEVGIDISKNLTWNKATTDVAKGPLEFFVYSMAVAMATEKKDPTYFKTYTTFLEVTAWLGARAMRLHREGIKFKHFQGFSQTKYLTDLQTHSSTKAMRDFCVRVFGQKWVDNVIFGKP